MSKKTFSSAPKPNQPSPEAITAFEQGGAGHDVKSDPVNPSPVRTARPRVQKTKVENEVPEPSRRLSLDLPASVHKRFKTACSATERKMTDEVVKFIERRTAELEKSAGVFHK